MGHPFLAIHLAVAAIQVAVGAHSEQSRSARSLALGGFEVPSKNHLRSDNPVNDNEEERVNSAVKDFNDLLPLEKVTGHLGRLAGRESDVKNGFEMPEAIIEKNAKLQPTLANPVHPVLAALVQATLAKSLSARRKDMSPKIREMEDQEAKWLKQGMDPDNLRELLKGVVKADELLEKGEMVKWIKIVEESNKNDPEQASTFDKNLANLVFSWDFRQKKVAKEYLRTFHHEEARWQEEKKLMDTRTQVIDSLMGSWLELGYSPAKVCKILGLSPKLRTGYDFARLEEWVKYLAVWSSSKKDNMHPLSV